MTIMKQAIVELVLLTLASVGVALAANGIRERKSIDLTKSYFETGTAESNNSVELSAKPAPSKTVETTPSAAARVPSTTQVEAKPTQNSAPANTGAVASPPASTKHLEHPYQRMALAEARKLFEDPQTKQGLNVFVDARDDEHFAEGHIPGAIQCFPYEVQRCIDKVMAAAAGAEKVVVYCGGGDCEDSIFMCRELIDAGVPEEAVFLFEGGWKEWSAGSLPTETGSK